MMSSLYTAASGMGALSRGMQIIGNNLANVNTVGFKQTMALYQDLLSSTVTAQSNNVTGISQKGHGAALGDARTIFTQGGFESSNTTTDMAISDGNGYFGVVKDGELLFTKAGNMRFDDEGYLLDPKDYNLVGRKITDGVVSGAYEPIRIDLSEGSPMLINPPSATTALTMYSNIGGAGDNSQNGIFGMAGSWNGTASPPLGSGQYGYSDAMTVYDDQGQAHAMTVYYDYAGEQIGVKLYEYVIGADPASDGSARAGKASAGLLMAGTMSFSSDGKIIGLSAFTPTGENPADFSAWAPAPLVNGQPAIQANFAGAGAQQIAFDCGLSMAGYPAGASSPADALASPDVFYAASAGATRVNGSTSAYAGGSSNYFADQNGHAQGALKDTQIDSDGFIIGRYTNGETEQLYQISLFRFISQDGLHHEGGNHFAATNESGPPEEGLPGTENYGAILSNNLETSNVDMAVEFTNMIITQRGFQANSKIVTTSDTMLQRALELKR